MLWKYCKSTDIDELQGSNWPFGSNCSGKLPSLHFTWLHKSHGRPRSCKKQLTKAFMDGPFCVRNSMLLVLSKFTYIHTYVYWIESKSVHMIFLAGFQDDLNIFNRTTVCNKFFMWKFWTWNFGPVVFPLVFCWLQV